MKKKPGLNWSWRALGVRPSGLGMVLRFFCSADSSWLRVCAFYPTTVQTGFWQISPLLYLLFSD